MRTIFIVYLLKKFKSIPIADEGAEYRLKRVAKKHRRCEERSGPVTLS